MRIKITLPLVNYTGPLCGFNFVASVAEVDDDGSATAARNLNRLSILYQGTTVQREGEPAKAPAPVKSPTPAKAPAKAPAPVKAKAKAKVLADEDDDKPRFESDDETGDDKE